MTDRQKIWSLISEQDPVKRALIEIKKVKLEGKAEPVHLVSIGVSGRGITHWQEFGCASGDEERKAVKQAMFLARILSWLNVSAKIYFLPGILDGEGGSEKHSELLEWVKGK